MKKTLRWILLFMLLTVAFCASALADEEGEFDTGVSWYLTEDMVLTLSGSGAMPDFASDLSDRPWGNDLSMLNIESGVTHVGAYAFSGCDQLSEIYLPASVRTVGENAFQGCSGLNIFTLSNPGVSLLGSGLPETTLLFCNGFIFEVVNGEATVLLWQGETAEAEIPATVGGYPVVGIVEGILNGGLFTEITLPESFPIQDGMFNANMTVHIGSNLSYHIGEDSSAVLTHLYTLESQLTVPSAFAGLPVVGVGPEAIHAPNALNVTIPEGIRFIGDGAFIYAGEIVNVSLPSTLNSIGDEAFKNNAIAFLSLPDAVTEIGEWAFAGNELTEVTLPGLHVAVGEGAFDPVCHVTSEEWIYTMYGSRLTIIGWTGSDANLTVPSTLNTRNVKGFGTGVFKNKTVLKSISIPYGVDTLGEQMLYGCSMLESANLNCQADTLPAQILFGCRRLTQVILPDTLTKVDRYALYNCVAIRNVSLPDTVTEIGANAFRGCAALETAPLPGELAILGANAFLGCNSLTEVVLPNSLTSLGEGVFTNCSALTDVTVGTGISYIGSTTFAGLKSLKHVTINGTVTVASEAFKDCTALQTVEIESGIINYGAFTNCSALRSFVLEGGSIVSEAFSGCTLLETVVLSNVNGITSDCFEYLPSLRIVSIYGGDITEIPYGAFRGCTALEMVTVSSRVTSVGQYAFQGCTKLNYVHFSQYLKNISDSAFQGCSSLTAFDMPVSLLTIGKAAFQDCEKLASLIMSPSLNEIGENAFFGCSALAEVNLPEDIHTIGKNAFPATTKVFCDPSSRSAIAISANGGSFIYPENPMFGIRLLLDDGISLGLAVEQIWTDETEVEIPEFIGGETVTELGANVFASCPGVSAVTLPASVPIIPDGMLEGNNTLISVVIPEGVTAVGASAFRNCEKLASVQLPSTVTSIGDYAFDGCPLLKEVQLSDKIQEIGVDAFKNIKVYCSLDSDTARMLSRTGGGFICREYPLLHLKYLFVGGEAKSLQVIGAEPGVASLEIPASVTSIADHAFMDMASLSYVTLPDTLTAIGAHAFDGTGIQSIEIPAGVTEIKEYTFANTTSLKDVKVKGIVTSVGDYAFQNSALTAIEFKDGLLSVGYYAFENARRLTTALFPDSTETLGDYIFQNCPALTHFTVPANVKKIPDYAFYQCMALKTVTIPEGVEEIGAYAFEESGLASVTLPASMRIVNESAFGSCQSLAEVTMQGDMETLETQAFYNCLNLARVQMPDTLKAMEESVFQDCASLKSITIPAGLKTVPSSAFNGCYALESLKIAEGVQKIEDNAFYNCRALSYVELPATLLEFGSYAFYNNCFARITLPESLTTIGSHAFGDNDALLSITIPSGVTTLGNYALSNCDNLSSVKLSSGLLTLNEYLFYNDRSLVTVAIPEGVRSINDYAFQYCYGLKSVLIPKSVTSIADHAFNGIDQNQLTVYCYHDTAAESFALTNGFAIIYLDGENVLEGLSVEAQIEEINVGFEKEIDGIEALFAILPKDIPYNVSLVYTTEDASIAALDSKMEEENGEMVGGEMILRGVSIGETKLIAYLWENPEIRAEITVHVRPNIVDFTLPEEIWQLNNEPLELKPLSSDPAIEDDGYTWTMDEYLGTFQDNVFTPTACGTAALKAVSWNGVEKTTVIHVYEEPTKVQFVGVPAGADVGAQITLNPQVTAGALFTGKEANHFLTYSSDNEKIATVDQNGVVTTMGYGTAVITAETENGVSGTANIHVSAPIESFNLQGRILAPVGATIELRATEVMPANANPNAFVWVTEPEGLVSYENGKVTVLTDQEAEVTITATSWDGALSKTTQMTIYRPAVESITFEPVEWVEPYKYVQLIAYVKAVNDFTNQLIHWEVEDEGNGVSIDQNGLLYTGSSGWHNQIVVTATADNGVSESMTVYAVYPTTSFEVPERIILETGAQKTVTPTKVRAENYSSEHEFSYQKFFLSFNSDLHASAEDMQIKGIAPGVAELTVRSWNGVERKVQVLVYDPITEISVDVEESDLPNPLYPTDLIVQETYQMHSHALGDQMFEDDLVTWTSSDPSIIRVEDKEKGVIRTVNYGTATITATAESGVTGEITLTVRKEVDTFTLPASFHGYVLSDLTLEAASITPEDAWDGFVWQVEPASLGAVEGNILHIAAEENAQGKIIATSWDGYVTKEAPLYIEKVPVTEITVDPVQRLSVGDGAQITAHVTAGAQYVNRFVTFSSSDDAVASVDANGMITAIAPGTVTITVAAEGAFIPGEEEMPEDEEFVEDEMGTGVYAQIEVTVVRGVSAFTVPERIYLPAGESTEIQITDIAPEDSLKEFIWQSGDEAALSVTPGELSATVASLSETAADITVTVKSWNGVEKQILVSIYTPATKVTLSEVPAGVAPGDTVQLSVQVEAGHLFGKELVSFSSSDDSIASVDENGLVTAHAYGRAIITATAESGAKDSVTIRVAKAVESFTLPSRFLVAAGTTTEFYVNDLLPADADPDAFVWTVEPAEIGTVKGDLFTAAVVESMTGTVTATSWDGSVSLSTVLQVYKPQVTDIEIEEVPRLWYGAEYQLIAHVFAGGNEYINELVTFSSNSSYITVDENGLIRCDEQCWDNYFTITVTAENGVSASVSFYVNQPITDFTVQEEVYLQVGHTHFAEILSYEGHHYGFTYTADDSGCVSVDSMGNVTALKAGDATVTVKAWSGLEKTVTIHVHDEVTAVSIDPVPVNQRIIETLQLNVRVMAEKEYGNELVTWSTSNHRVASVNENGLVSTLSYGEATITAAAENGVSASVLIRVSKEMSTFTLPESYSVFAECDLALFPASFAPGDATADFVWSVSPAEIGSVEGNILHVTAKEACEGTVTATSWDGAITRTAKLIVVKEEVTALALDPVENTELIVGDTLQLIARVTAGGVEFENKYVSFASSDENVLSVNEKGLITVIGKGEATITVTSDNGFTESLSFTAVQGVVSFDVPESLIVYYGYPTELPITNIFPADAEDRPFTYTFAPDPNYEYGWMDGAFQVEDGKISISNRDGEVHAILTVTSWNGVSREVLITAKEIYPEMIIINPLPELLTDGMTIPITASMILEGREYVNDSRYMRLSASNNYGWDDVYTVDQENWQIILHEGRAEYNLSVWVTVGMHMGNSESGYVRTNLRDFSIASVGDAPKCGDVITLRTENQTPNVNNMGSLMQVNAVWTAEPADAVAIEGNQMTILTKDAVEVTLTATAWNGLQRTLTFTTVQVTEIEDFTLPARIFVPIGGTLEVPITGISPEGAGIENFNFSVETGAAEVINGVIHALADYETSTTLVVRSWNGVEKTATIMIYAPNVTKIELDPVPLYRSEEGIQLEARVWVDGVEVEKNQYVTFECYYDEGLNYHLNGSGMGSIGEDGLLKVTTGGDSRFFVVAKAANGLSVVVPMRVYHAYDSFSFPDPILLYVNENGASEYHDIRPETYTPSNSSPILYTGPDNYGFSQADIVFTVENEDLVYFDCSEWSSIRISGRQVGETIMTATGRNGVTDTFRIIAYDTIDGVSVNEATPMSLYGQQQMSARVSLNGIEVETNELITWESSDYSILSVNDQGLVRAVGYGTATVTAVTQNGLTASVEITVYEDTQNFNLPEGLAVTYGDSIEIPVSNFAPETGFQQFTYSVAPAEYAEMNGSVLTPLVNENVEVTVTVTSWDGLSRSTVVKIVAAEQEEVVLLFKLPAFLTEIGDEAFAGTAFSSVRIADGCVSIGSRAFADSPLLRYVYIPESVGAIAEDAFAGCNSLTIVGVKGSFAEQYAKDHHIAFSSQRPTDAPADDPAEDPIDPPADEPMDAPEFE